MFYHSTTQLCSHIWCACVRLCLCFLEKLDLCVRVDSVGQKMRDGQYSHTHIFHSMPFILYGIYLYIFLFPCGGIGFITDLEVAQPQFSGSVNGLASYVAYPVPLPLEYSLELSFKIHPTTISQISLLAFIGQNGYHDEKSDHFAVSFIQGNFSLGHKCICCSMLMNLNN